MILMSGWQCLTRLVCILVHMFFPFTSVCLFFWHVAHEKEVKGKHVTTGDVRTGGVLVAVHACAYVHALYIVFMRIGELQAPKHASYFVTCVFIGSTDLELA